jgi:apolipoprotein N-acyltransferase
VNGGVSGFIDPYGRLVAAMMPGEGESGSPGFMSHPVEVVRTHTFYTVYGDVFARTMTVIAGMLILVPFRRRQPAVRNHIPGPVYVEKMDLRSAVVEFGQRLRRARP